MASQGRVDFNLYVTSSMNPQGTAGCVRRRAHQSLIGDVATHAITEMLVGEASKQIQMNSDV
jgi:hypothetical protein